MGGRGGQPSTSLLCSDVVVCRLLYCANMGIDLVAIWYTKDGIVFNRWILLFKLNNSGETYFLNIILNLLEVYIVRNSETQARFHYLIIQVLDKHCTKCYYRYMTKVIGYITTLLMAKVFKKEFEFWVEDKDGNQQLLYWTIAPTVCA